MLVVFFALWVVFNGRLTWEVAAFGAVISCAMYLFCCAFLDYSPKKDWQSLRRVPAMLRYVWLLIREIVKANIALNRIVLRREIEVKPRLVTFKTPLKGVSRAVLADSITLTPGTITVELKDDELTVHCLDAGFAEGIERNPFEQALERMQGGEENG